MGWLIVFLWGCVRVLMGWLIVFSWVRVFVNSCFGGKIFFIREQKSFIFVLSIRF